MNPSPNPETPAPLPQEIPSHTPIPTEAILDAVLPPQALQALARLYAAAHASGYRHTPSLDFERQLLPLLHLSRSRARELLRMLRLARLITWSTDGANGYTIHLAYPAIERTGSADSDVVAGINLTSLPAKIQQHPTRSEKPDTNGFLSVLDSLLRAGVWSDAALRIEEQITQNVRRGHTYLPDLRDVLGWIAYCYAYKNEHKLDNPAAVLAANLNANRRCPDRFRPPYMCFFCKKDEAHCACSEPDLRLPPKFLEFAFDQEYDDTAQSFWGVCRRCHCLKCECGQGESDEEDDSDFTG